MRGRTAIKPWLAALRPRPVSRLIGLFIGMVLLALHAGDSLSMMGGMMDSGHGNMMRGMMQEMMGGMLPPGIDPADLPEPRSAGARLLKQYCAQCHNLPAPGMHTAEEWPQVVSRMNRRMQMMGGGMMGGGMMGIEAPTEAELRILIGYLQKHAQKPLHPEKYEDLDLSAGSGKSFRTTCAQCHALPDPKQHTAQEWPTVVARMKRNMVAMGKPVPNETTLEEIIAFLQRHSRE